MNDTQNATDQSEDGVGDILERALDATPITIDAVCHGLGKRYAAALQSALTRRAEGWEECTTQGWRTDWYNLGGQWSSRSYAVRLWGDTPVIAVTPADPRREAPTTFALMEHDIDALTRRFQEVILYKDALECEEIDVVSEHDLHGRVLRYRGLELDPNGTDDRWSNCRRGLGECPECGRYRESPGHVAVAYDARWSRPGTPARVTVSDTSRRTYRGARSTPADRLIGTVSPERIPELLKDAGLRPVQDFEDGVAYAEVVDQDALDAQLAEPFVEAAPEVVITPEPAVTPDVGRLESWEIALLTDLTEDEAMATDGALVARIVTEVTAELGTTYGAGHLAEVTRRIRASLA